MSIYDKSSLVLIPSGTKTGKVYSQKPVSGDGDFTFTRSSAATRVNEDGNIEKETQNLLLQSNFSSSWSAPVATMTGGQNGYDGSSDAWLLSATANFARIEQTNSSNGVVTLSVYAKAGTADWIMLRLTGSGFNDQQYFDLANGTIGINRGCIAADIEDVGGGWYRCSATTSGPTLQYAIMYIALADGNLSPTNENIYIQDAQLEQGLVARDYIETTTTAVEGGITDNVPRLDYTDSSCPALLLEPQRTNLVTQSEYYGGSDWSRTRCGFVTNTSETLSPEGLYNASKMLSIDASESYAQDNVTLGSTSGTFTFFAKKGDLDYCHALVWDISANGRRQWFNLATGAVGTTTNFGSGYTKVDATIEDYGNGWYRCSFSWSGGNTTSGVRINISSGDGVIGSPINSYGYFYGAQCEASASYATSYIPTYGSSVSRVKDDCTLSDVSNVIADSKGSFYIEGNLSTSDTSGVIVLTAGANTQDLFYIFITTAGVLLCEWFDGGNLQARLQAPAGSISVGDSFKIAVAYQDNDFVAYWNGTQIGTDSSGTAPTPTLLRIGKYNVDNYTGGSYTNVMVFPTRLSNEELAALTTI